MQRVSSTTERAQLAADIADFLGSSGLTVAVAESSTGGMVPSALAEAPGSSAWFCGPLVAYIDKVKHELLHVPPGPVVTADAAAVMANEVRRLLGADVSVSLTGAAGPDSHTYTMSTSHGSLADGPDALPVITTPIDMIGPATITRGFGTFRIAEVSPTGALTLITGSAVGDGGAILNHGAVTLTNSSLSGNTATGNGGGLANADTPSGTAPAATVTRSPLSDNGPGLSGGGIAAVDSTTSTFTQTAVSTNRADRTAGGVYRSNGTMTSTNSPISANTANNCLGSTPAVPTCTADQPEPKKHLSTGIPVLGTGIGRATDAALLPSSAAPPEVPLIAASPTGRTAAGLLDWSGRAGHQQAGTPRCTRLPLPASARRMCGIEPRHAFALAAAVRDEMSVVVLVSRPLAGFYGALTDDGDEDGQLHRSDEAA